uniref:Uncharacterized protein n=1 Tax=Chromera velia CCMP2878 TaxID=1169474 RepID=A0A0K6S785_9ALVE|eukprot:Cvel_20143.t2-p1 / transcript=Cvel_20143.t2 / gene=Cvel_20143 / organism=Chromera_velia_CCMP2878 / gene_product=hypothetical protein / transcript_product=hypothetical protein / location=Cvel_scaffold1787:36430-37896(-) / protein_length=223 / sequence_SO=supercontig / SO=protein_coding / is_pseudo=false
MKCLSVDPPIESFVDGRLKSCLDSIADEMDTSESAHLFALEPACEEETEEGGERGEEEEEDEDVLDEKEKEAIPRLLDLSLSVSGVRQAAAPPDSSQGTKDEGQTSLHNSKGVHLSTVVKKGLSLFMPNSSTNTSTQGCFRFRAACTDAPAGNCVPESSTVLLDIAKEHAAAQEREKQRKERLERCEARGLRVAARRGARQDYRELCRLDNFADSGPEDLDSE